MSMIDAVSSLQRAHIGHASHTSSVRTYAGNSARRPAHQPLTAKRLLDVCGATFALILLHPVLVLVAVAVKLESKGPVLFVQDRWGKDRTIIRVLKFRTMRQDAGDPSGVRQTVEGDPRVTRLGRFLRSSNLDELPQLINVLKGEMSLVGPRCHPIGMLAAGVRYEELVPFYHVRHSVTPGMTGLAQIKGMRGPTVNADKAVARIRYDRLYLRKRSVWLDLRIIARTMVLQFRGGTGF